MLRHEVADGYPATRMGADVAYRSCWSRRSSADRSSRGVHLHDPYTLRSYGESTASADIFTRETAAISLT